jgi:hypothetical protein
VVDVVRLQEVDTSGVGIAFPKYLFNASDTVRQAKLFIKSIRDDLALGDKEKGILSQGATLMTPLLQALDNGYIDFLLLQAETPLQEKMNVLRLAGDQYIVHFTGQEPPVFSYGGVLKNARNANHLNHFIAAYNYFIRASRASSVGAQVVLRYDDFRVKGQMTNLTTGIRGEQQVAGTFSFQVLVKEVTLRIDTGSGMLLSGRTADDSATLSEPPPPDQQIAYASDDASEIKALG